ncbi:heavy-metal-associated domain-containing protein [Verticiella sediminum]|uniref:Heavy-metal-associated domain-containing protein n=1 Tax=Verticiella sediminum TaxID=1247510 RepID=A0A556AUZ1_9BURK|nr:heavy metal-associated domain-containing protein [Verticiella sediminum]TSH96762.1 heavy-metal-associated domain-containing protein [Verticiella sediminum]
MSNIDLDVQGMSCGACVKHVTEALKPLPGVREVEVDLGAGRVRVRGDLAEGIDPLVSALKQAGYPAQPSGTEASTAPGNRRGGCCCG